MAGWTRRALIVEDEPFVASLLADYLEGAGFQVRSCGSAAEVDEQIEDFDPDVALIDIHLGRGPSGLHVGQLLHRTSPEVGLVFLTKYADPRIGPGTDIPPDSAFLDKGTITDPAILLDAVDRVLREHEGAPPRAQVHGELATLTRTQLEILHLAALGLTNAAIARKRDTNERAVEKRMHAVYAALGIATNADINPRVEAIRRYIAQAGIPNDA